MPAHEEKLPLLLFCHANGFCKDVWKPVAEELTAFAIAPFRWVAMDFSGHGGSRPIPPGGTAEWRFAAEDVVEVLDEYQDGSPVMGIGHSMGGAALLLASLGARRDPDFRSLVLFEPIVLPSHPDETLLNPLIASALRRRAAWPSAEEAHAYLTARSAFRRFDPRAAAAYVRGGTRPARDDGSDGVVLACDPQDEAAIYRDGPRRLRERVHEVACPCHVVSGELSAPPMHSDYFRRLARAAARAPPGPAPAEGEGRADAAEGAGGWGWSEVPGAGHFLVMEEPRAAAAAIAAAARRTGFASCFRAHGGEMGCGP